MKILCIYHGNCADGFGAAWAVRRSLGAENVEFIAGSYGMPTPDVAGRLVIIVDFSFPLEVLQAMADQARAVLVLDHHKTAAEALAGLEPAPLHYHAWADTLPKLSAVFDMNRSGAGITWDFFFPQNQRPDLINHIEDRDLWRFKLEGTSEVLANLFSYAQDFQIWDELMQQPMSAAIAAGVAINRKHQKDVAELVASSKHRMVIAGHDVPVANLPHIYASDACHLMARHEKFAACYQDSADHRYFSLRSNDAGMDVSEIAKKYGGGGHRNAAGFKAPFELAVESNQPEGSAHAWRGRAGLYRTRLEAVSNCEQSVTPVSANELFELARKQVQSTLTAPPETSMTPKFLSVPSELLEQALDAAAAVGLQDVADELDRILTPTTAQTAMLIDALPSVAIEGDQLVIRITTECLLHAVTCSPEWPIDYKGAPISIQNGTLLIQEIIHELQREDEQGANQMHRMLDQAAQDAINNGSEAVSYD